jgi:hypothetical protein
LEHLKAANDNKAFTLSHCWIVIKDSKKWEDSFALWQELKKKKGKGNNNASMDGVIDLDVQEPCLGNLAGESLHLMAANASLQDTRLPRPTSPDSPVHWRSKKPSRDHGQEGRGHCRERGVAAQRQRGHHQELC